MGQSVIEYVVQLLNDGGIRAAAALPPGNLLRVTEPVAAVSLAGANTEKSSVTVLVEIVGPERLGGGVCQLKALDVCRILAAVGGSCQQGSCAFLNKGNLFCVPVTAVCYGENSSGSCKRIPMAAILFSSWPRYFRAMPSNSPCPRDAKLMI